CCCIVLGRCIQDYTKPSSIKLRGNRAESFCRPLFRSPARCRSHEHIVIAHTKILEQFLAAFLFTLVYWKLHFARQKRLSNRFAQKLASTLHLMPRPCLYCFVIKPTRRLLTNILQSYKPLGPCEPSNQRRAYRTLHIHTQVEAPLSHLSS